MRQSKQCCAKSMLLRDCIWIQFFFIVWAKFWASPFGVTLVEIGLFLFSIFINPIFGCNTICSNWILSKF